MRLRFRRAARRTDPASLAGRFVSPLLRRILLVNAVPLALLVAALLYLDQYQNGLLAAEISALREQASIFAGAIGQAAVDEKDLDAPRLVPELARPLLHRLTDPTPNAQAKLYDQDGTLIADSRIEEGPGGAVTMEPLPPPAVRGVLIGTIGQVYDWVLAHFPLGTTQRIRVSDETTGKTWQPAPGRPGHDQTGPNSAAPGEAMAPDIRRTHDGRLLVTVAEPVLRNRQTVGYVVLTREARDVDDRLMAIRLSILGLFGLALLLTVILSWYLSRTIARPLLRLAEIAAAIREGRSGRQPRDAEGSAVPITLRRRQDEIGALATTLAESAQALWTRMDAIEQFAADVAHEIKNPLSSIRSAIETLTRIRDPESQGRLLAIVADDVRRLDRLISDISDASRVDAELSRAAIRPIDIAELLRTLESIHSATAKPDAPAMALDVPVGRLDALGVEDRVVQVLRNLIGNAASFSPPGGVIRLSAREQGGMIEIVVEDDGPGIPEAKLEHVFDRFYSERPSDEGFGQHSGLGLSISRQIVEALNGTIRAENRREPHETPRGARFTVRLPRA